MPLFKFRRSGGGKKTPSKSASMGNLHKSNHFEEEETGPGLYLFLFPHRKNFPLSFLPATPSSPSPNHEGLFQLTRCPSRAIDSHGVLLPELQRKNNTFRCATLGAKVLKHRQQLTQTLIVQMSKTHSLTVTLNLD